MFSLWKYRVPVTAWGARKHLGNSLGHCAYFARYYAPFGNTALTHKGYIDVATGNGIRQRHLWDPVGGVNSTKRQQTSALQICELTGQIEELINRAQLVRFRQSAPARDPSDFCLYVRSPDRDWFVRGSGMQLLPAMQAFADELWEILGLRFESIE